MQYMCEELVKISKTKLERGRFVKKPFDFNEADSKIEQKVGSR